MFAFNLRFPGQYYDSETGKHYNYFRDYDPTVGRYLETDPIEFDAGLNLYTYVSSSPVSWKDPLGLHQFRGGVKPMDGCGPNGQGLENAIPDNPLGYPFRKCCDGHDNCYGDCKNKPPKGKCDEDFCACLTKQCGVGRRGGAKPPDCLWLAEKYCQAVKEKGQGAFDASRKDYPGCK